jgi:hypothetical protein
MTEVSTLRHVILRALERGKVSLLGLGLLEDHEEDDKLTDVNVTLKLTRVNRKRQLGTDPPAQAFSSLAVFPLGPTVAVAGRVGCGRARIPARRLSLSR